jgi:glycine cleavage system transcriptional repressor
VTRAVADHGGNIVDLTTRVVGDAARPVYVMLIDLTLPTGASSRALQESLTALSGELSVDCTLRPADVDVL